MEQSIVSKRNLEQNRTVLLKNVVHFYLKSGKYLQRAMDFKIFVNVVTKVFLTRYVISSPSTTPTITNLLPTLSCFSLIFTYFSANFNFSKALFCQSTESVDGENDPETYVPIICD